MRGLRSAWPVVLVLVIGACSDRGSAEPVLPSPDSVVTWFGEPTTARLSGNVLEIRGEIEGDFIRRGGRIWERGGPYFYLFNVHVRDLLVQYPDLAAVRAVTVGPDGRELARAMLHRAELSEFQWNEALARASLAQTQGTENPRRIEELIRFGEEHTEFSYSR